MRRKVTKVTKVDVSTPAASGGSSSSRPELSRREREELDKQRAAANYQKLHAEGKTDQARADLARLAIIKQHRAEAAARREQEKKGKRIMPASFASGITYIRFVFAVTEKDDKAAKAKAK